MIRYYEQVGLIPAPLRIEALGQVADLLDGLSHLIIKANLQLVCLEAQANSPLALAMFKQVA